MADYELLIKHRTLLILGGMCVAIYPLAFYKSMALSGIAIGTIISIASAPFFVVILERFFNNQKISARWLISFIIGSLGVALLAMGKSHENTPANSLYLHNIGIALGAISGLTYACYSWVAKQFIEKGIQAQSAMAAQFGFAALVLLPSLALPAIIYFQVHQMPR